MSAPGILERVQRRLAERLAGPEASAADLAALVREEAGVISDVELLDVLRRLREDTTGVGCLGSVLARPEVTDVVVNAPDEVWCDRGNGLERVDVAFADDADLRRTATRMAQACGRRLDDARPYADGALALADGRQLRIHALLSPPAERHPLLSIRVLRQANLSLAALAAGGLCPPEALALLREMVERRRSFLVTGGTGSGKTTLLSALLAEVPHDQRIICIEDTPELLPPHPHVVSLVARGANVEGRGEITLADLVRQSLRMRPDRIIVGEIRGAEVVDLLAALNTGHEGGGGTLHANSLAEVPARLEALAALGGLGREALHAQLAAAVHTIVAVQRTAEGKRRLQGIARLRRAPLSVETVWEAS